MYTKVSLSTLDKRAKKVARDVSRKKVVAEGPRLGEKKFRNAKEKKRTRRSRRGP